MIIDCHSHLGKCVMEDVDDKERTFLSSTVDDFKNVQKELDVKFIVMGYETSPEKTVPYPELNKKVIGEVKANPDVFLGCLPFVHAKEDTVEGMEKQICPEVKGFKFYLSGDKIRPDDKCLDPFMELATKKKIPVMFDIWAYKPDDMKRIIETFPDLQIIIAHFTEHLPWRNYATIEFVKKYDHVSCDTTLVQCCYKMLELAVKEMGPERILFGTDFPLFDVKALHAALLSHNLTEEQNNKILYENAKRVFKL